MFSLVEMKDVIRIKPWNFKFPLIDSLTYELNRKFSNKVVHNVGLCISLFDVSSVGKSFIVPGDGASHTQVCFRFVVFRPLADEIILGKIKASSAEGIHVSLGFFDDILITPEYLQQDSTFDDSEQLWVWRYENEGGSHDLFMDINETIRFRVVDEEFIDLTPTAPLPSLQNDSTVAELTELKKAPYSIIGSIADPGLGLLSWWN